MASPFCVIVLLCPVEPSVGGMVVGESFPAVPCVEPGIDVVSPSSGSWVGVVLLGLFTVVEVGVVVVVASAVLTGGSVSWVELIGTGVGDSKLGEVVVVVTIMECTKNQKVKVRLFIPSFYFIDSCHLLF